MMHDLERQFSFERLELWQLALCAMEKVHVIAGRLGQPHAALADQMRRASVSICANPAEGVGKMGEDQMRFFAIARGSTYEAAGLIEVALRLGRVSPTDRQAARLPLLSVAAILTTLLRGSVREPAQTRAQAQ